MNPLCIYHGNCTDGFAAAWVVRKFFNGAVDFHPGFYGRPAPDVEGRDVVMVDFSYPWHVLDLLAMQARSILILDHHKTAAEDLSAYPPPHLSWHNHALAVDLREAQDHREGQRVIIYALFDMERSGAGLTWDFFFPTTPRPALLNHIEDRDLWRFRLPETRDLHACLSSHPYDFDLWDALIQRAQLPAALHRLSKEGEAIHRKLMKDIGELLQVVTRRLVIGGVSVPAANLPYVMASEAANIMAVGEPFAATYCDTKDGRHFSLRSAGAKGMDVAAIAEGYGGGGHRNAAGFKMPIGWEGDPTDKG